jgi:hypothetical protein
MTFELVCYEVGAGRVDIEPARRRRAWMDATRGAMAYKCLPLVMANVHGWEMLCPFPFAARWNGGDQPADLTITADASELVARPEFILTHFGCGILSFNPTVIMRTPPGYNLWLTGPTNSFKDGAQCMNASIETDWMPFNFSVNWKLTRPGADIRFEKDEPFCTFFPIQRGVVSRCEPRFAPLAEQPAVQEQYHWGQARRHLDVLLADREKDRFQGWYAAGTMPKREAGEAPADHETNIVAQPFRR